MTAPMREVVAVLAKLVEHDAQEARVAGQPGGRQRVEMLGVQSLRVPGEESDRDGTAFARHRAAGVR